MIKKSIASLLIISMLVPAFYLSIWVKKASAQIPVTDVAAVGLLGTLVAEKSGVEIPKTIKDIALQILKVAGMAIARALLNKMTQATINWINGGFKGKPGFIENPGLFFTDIAKQQINGFVNEIGYDPLKFPFGKNFALDVINQTRSSFEQVAQSTFSQLTTDPGLISGYQNDFSVGGWNGFLINTQQMQNNIFGFQMIASSELQNRITGPDSPVQKVKDEVQQSLGFLSQQECKSNPNWNPDMLKQGPPNTQNDYNPPHAGSGTTTGSGGAHDAAPPTSTGTGTTSGTGGLPGLSPSGVPAAIQYDINYTLQKKQELLNWQTKYGCPEGPSTVTPGSAVGNLVTTALSSGQHQSELAAALGSSVAAIIDSLLNKLLTTGLSKLSNFISGADQNVNQNINNFNYYGSNTSTGSGTVGNLPTSFTQLEVSLSVTNDNGTGTLSEGDVNIFVDGNLVDNNNPNSLSAGSHLVSISTANLANLANYTITFSNACAADGTVNIADGTTAVCTISMNDVPLTVGGSGTTAQLTVTVDASGLPSGVLLQGLVDGNPVDSTPTQYNPGTYTVSAAPYAGYASNITGDCAADGTIILQVGDVRTCTITYVPNTGSATLTVTTQLSGLSAGIVIKGMVDGSFVPPAPLQYSVGLHTVSAEPYSTYTPLIGGDCAPNGNIVLQQGDNKTCTITYQ